MDSSKRSFDDAAGERMDFLIRMPQWHESFRQPELQAMADLHGINLEWVRYSSDSPFAHIRLASIEVARALIPRAILTDSIYQLWGFGTDLESLHDSVRKKSSHIWPQFAKSSFRFTVLGYRGKRNREQQLSIINSFRYLPFAGEVTLRNPDEEFFIFEEYPEIHGINEPYCLHFARLIQASNRHTAVAKYDLKKRTYIDTTSMDAELALVTANLAHAAAGKLLWDPFTGTGGFLISGAHFGAIVFGSDIDGRSVRGKGFKLNGSSPQDQKRVKDVKANFRQYGLVRNYLDSFVADVTHSPLREGRWLDGILCDPPYGVREGLKVLGNRKEREGMHYIDGKPAYLSPEYIPPKKPYSFDALLEDILELAAEKLVDGGRLAMWMPAANQSVAEGDDTDVAEVEIAIPQNRYLKLSSVCVQPFNKWSRRLLTYIRLPESEIGPYIPRERDPASYTNGKTNADDLNQFRKQYFEGFKHPSLNKSQTTP